MQAQTESYTSMTQAMQQVTTNYLLQEQRLCDNWAALVGSRPMSMSEAVDMVAASQSHKDDVMAHLVYADDKSYEGLSTHPKAGDEDDYTVSYKGMDLFKDLDTIEPLGRGINITRAYSNPTDGVQSIAPYTRVSVLDEEGNDRDALLVRVVPISVLSRKWAFPSEEFKDAEISLIDENGNYNSGQLVQGVQLL